MADWNTFSKTVGAGTKSQYTPAEVESILGTKLDTASFDSVFTLRNSPEFKKNIPFQNAIAPYEHRAFNREQVESAPTKLEAIKSAIAQGILTGGYTPAKVINNTAKAINPDLQFLQSRSNPSWEEFTQGFSGIGDGLRLAFNK